MLDIAVIRADPERIRTMLRNRNYPEDTLNEFLGLDAEWRRLMEEGNQLRRKRNEASVQVPKLKGEEKANLLAEMKAVAQRISDIEVRVAESGATARGRGPPDPEPTGRIGPGGGRL